MNTAPNSTVPPDAHFVALIRGYGEAISRRDRLHIASLGKSMTNDVYLAFTTLRDETVPRLEAELLTAMQARQTLPMNG